MWRLNYFAKQNSLRRNIQNTLASLRLGVAAIKTELHVTAKPKRISNRKGAKGRAEQTFSVGISRTTLASLRRGAAAIKTELHITANAKVLAVF